MLSSSSSAVAAAAAAVDKVQVSVVQQWADMDPNPLTAAAARQLMTTLMMQDDSSSNNNNNNNDDDSNNAIHTAETLFQQHFAKRISFGTAGLRSEMTFGPAHMNDLVVLQTAQGLVRYLQDYCTTNNNDTFYSPLVIIGYDHRQNASLQLSSRQFAIWTALVCETAGVDYLLLDGLVATPMVPFAMKYYSQSPATTTTTSSTTPTTMSATSTRVLPLGIMVTASHNPKQDNGYKVYWIDGCQIRPPIDKGMAEAIFNNLTLWTDYSAMWTERQAAAKPQRGECCGLSDPIRTRQVIDAYMQELANAVLRSNLSISSSSTLPLTIYYSAMHGVGYPFVKQAVETACCNIAVQLVPVPQQQHPDPTFPTVDFPNPEEPGALDMAMAFATNHHRTNTHSEGRGTMIVLANDPDADRLAVAEYSNGQWKVFTGNEIGALLAHWLYTIMKKTPASPPDQDDSSHDKPLAMCCSTVSSQFVPTMAKAEGIHCVETLTGFKWIGSQAAAMQASGEVNVVFCYEEAIGFCCGNVIFDKDGISAAVYMIQLIAHVHQKVTTLSAHLQSLHDKYGEFVSYNGYYRIPTGSDNAAIVASIMQHMQRLVAPEQGGFLLTTTTSPGPLYKIQSVRYLGEPGYDSTTENNVPVLPTSASSPMMTIHFENGCVAHFRASGTEPKFKYYMEMKGEPGVPREQVQAELEKMAPLVLETLIEPGKYNMKQGM